jgi:hypothetical protein
MPSILAVLQPADTTYLYFVAKNDGSGEHVFAETPDEQDANRAKYGNIDNGSDANGDAGGSTQIEPIDNVSGG